MILVGLAILCLLQHFGASLRPARAAGAVSVVQQ